MENFRKIDENLNFYLFSGPFRSNAPENMTPRANDLHAPEEYIRYTCKLGLMAT